MLLNVSDGNSAVGLPYRTAFQVILFPQLLAVRVVEIVGISGRSVTAQVFAKRSSS
jgi:hypothetical protein